MNYQLVAVDLDDTLLDEQLQISAANQNAIRLAVEQGVTITIATGRMFRSARLIANSLGLNCPLIAYNGALIKNLLDGQVLFSSPLPLSLARKIICLVEGRGYTLNCYVDDNLYVKQVNGAVKQYAATAKVTAFAVGSLLSFLETDPTKLLVMGDEEELDLLAVELNLLFGGKISLTKSKPDYLEILNRQVSKGRALKFLCQKLGVDLKQTIAIGDNYNDLEMLEFAGLGVIMGNAREELKTRADYIAPANSKNGVAHVLERFILKNE